MIYYDFMALSCFRVSNSLICVYLYMYEYSYCTAYYPDPRDTTSTRTSTQILLVRVLVQYCTQLVPPTAVQVYSM